MDNDSIEQSLDTAHAHARRAYLDRDLDAYMAGFTPDLSYRQANGKVIGKDQLSRDVRSQLVRIAETVPVFKRQSVRPLSDGAEETLVQTVWGFATAFGLLHRIWHLERHATYTWVVLQGVWRIRAVDVHSESLAHAGWRFGRKPTLPPFDA
jgi:hypothetical protein